MAETSGISWTKSTFNPWIGCTRVGPGCLFCYAEKLDATGRFGKPHWGPGVARKLTATGNWNEVRRWNKKAPDTEFAGRKGFWPVFSASLADVFDNEVPPEWRADFWALVKDCPNLTFQIVTKRIGNAAKMLPPDWGEGYPNVWMIATVVNPEEVNRDVPKLLQLPAAVRGLSVEPMLAGMDLENVRWHEDGADLRMNVLNGDCWVENSNSASAYTNAVDGNPVLDWIICGGESGSKAEARSMDLDWAVKLREQCGRSETAFFMKQLGSAPVMTCIFEAPGGPRTHTAPVAIKDRKGGDMEEFPRILRVREFPR